MIKKETLLLGALFTGFMSIANASGQVVWSGGYYGSTVDSRFEVKYIDGFDSHGVSKRVFGLIRKSDKKQVAKTHRVYYNSYDPSKSGQNIECGISGSNGFVAVGDCQNFELRMN